jgi:threonine aldolase
MVENVDTVMFCLSKGLGAPIGSVLAGPEAFVDRARRVRKLLGGGMRQAGIVAGPGLVALENVGRLADDHANAERLAAGLDAVPGISAPRPDSNIVMADTSELGLTAEQFTDALADHDVLASGFGEYVTRFCTHLDVDAADVETALDHVETVAADAA